MCLGHFELKQLHLLYIVNCSWWKTFEFFTVPLTEIISFNKDYKMALYNFKACEKDTCDMPLPSPSGLLKKQLDSAVTQEACYRNNCRTEGNFGGF